MSTKWQAYVKDPRRICKYGAHCYQKNPDHLRDFKHAPIIEKKNVSPRIAKASPCKTKKLKDIDLSTNNRAKRKRSSDYSVLESSNAILTTVEKLINSNVNDMLEAVQSGPPTFFQSTSDDKEKLKELFLVDMPDDFFTFFNFTKELGDDVVKELASVNLMLIGPYDLLLNRLQVVDDKELYLAHWKFFYDPPEFQAVLKGLSTSEYHMGYYRDSPDEAPEFVGASDSSKDCSITPLAKNIFGAVLIYLENEKKSIFRSQHCLKMIGKLKAFAAKNSISLDPYNLKERHSKVVSRTLHGAGIVVPYDKKTKLGYRPLVESVATLKKWFAALELATTQEEKDKIMSDLQPVITYADIAVDECDFGTGLECGINMFCSGVKLLEPSAQSSLCSAYSLLKRDSFAKIVQAHIKYRRKGFSMSTLVYP